VVLVVFPPDLQHTGAELSCDLLFSSRLTYHTLVLDRAVKTICLQLPGVRHDHINAICDFFGNDKHFSPESLSNVTLAGIGGVFVFIMVV